MKIGISAFAGDAGKSGISQYMINLFRRFPEHGAEDEFVLFMSESDRPHFNVEHERVTIVTSPDWVGKPVINILWHLVMLPLALRRHGCDVVFMPAANRRLSWWYGRPSVGTVHDLSQLHVEGKYDPLRMYYVTRLLPRMMKRLDQVVSVSEATRRDLESFVGIAKGATEVVYNGADLGNFRPMDRDECRRKMAETFGIEPPYLLYTARLEHPGKNHVRLLEAYAKLRETTDFPHQLVCAGSDWQGAEVVHARVRELGLEQAVCFPGFVPNEDLPTLYAGADLFVFPSLFEGFGIPLLEAMASGTPVCASNVSSIPEVVGEAGLLFDPDNSTEICETIAKLLKNDALRAKLVDQGLERSQHFTWDDAARRVLELCHRTAER